MHVFAAVSEADARQSHGTLLGQSESLRQLS
jgi:hypothetical protein